MRAIWSAISREAGMGSRTIASILMPGGSYSRTTSSPCRALERQWMRRSESPGRYSRIPNSSLPEPARGAARLVSISRVSRRPASDVNRGRIMAISESDAGRRPTKKPSGSLVWILHPLAATGPRRSAGRASTRDHPPFGTRPVPAEIDLSPTRPSAHTGPRAPRRAWIAISSPKPSPSKTGAGIGPLCRTCSGSCSAGEPATITVFRTAR